MTGIEGSPASAGATLLLWASKTHSLKQKVRQKHTPLGRKSGSKRLPASLPASLPLSLCRRAAAHGSKDFEPLVDAAEWEQLLAEQEAIAKAMGEQQQLLLPPEGWALVHQGGDTFRGQARGRAPFRFWPAL